MKCSHKGCSGTLRVTHTYTGLDSKFQRANCPDCGSVYCCETTVTLVTARGEGAKAHAARKEPVCSTESC